MNTKRLFSQRNISRRKRNLFLTKSMRVMHVRIVSQKWTSIAKYVRAVGTQIADIELLEQLGEIVEKEKIKVSVELFTNHYLSALV